MAQQCGFHDLGVAVDNDAAFGKVKQANMANTLIRLGYDAVAFNVSVTAPLKGSDKCQLVLCQEEVEGGKVSEKKGKKIATRDPAALRLTGWGDERPGGKRKRDRGAGLIQQYTRVTVTVEDLAHMNALNDAIVASYDILAVRPTTEKVFEACCKQANVDIISLDLSSRLAFFLKPALTCAAVQRGLHFEIAYANSLRDSGSRRQFVSNAQGLCRATRGKGIILTSDAAREMEVRSPHDVLNLSILFGVDVNTTPVCMKENSAAVLKHAQGRKRGPGLVAGVVSAHGKRTWEVPTRVGVGAGKEGQLGDFMTVRPASDDDEHESGDDEGEEGGEGEEEVEEGNGKEAEGTALKEEESDGSATP